MAPNPLARHVPTSMPRDLKKQLVAQGFQVYRTLTDRVVLAERVRENLIMDSGVSAVVNGTSLAVQLVFRAQASDFPGENADQLLERARSTAGTAAERGYREVTTRVTPMQDPGDPARVLDTWHEVVLQREVPGTSQLAEELRLALSLTKIAQR